MSEKFEKIGKSSRGPKSRGLPKIVTGPRALTLSVRGLKQVFQHTFRMHARTEWVEMNGDISGLEARCNAVETNEMRDLYFDLIVSAEENPSKAEAMQHFVDGLEDLDCDEDTCEVIPSKSLNEFLEVVWKKTGWEVVGEIDCVVPGKMAASMRRENSLPPSVPVRGPLYVTDEEQQFECNMDHADFDTFFATLPAVSMVKSAQKRV